jgi:hypothetical protein
VSEYDDYEVLSNSAHPDQPCEWKLEWTSTHGAARDGDGGIMWAKTQHYRCAHPDCGNRVDAHIREPKPFS